MTLIRELITIPERVHQGDFVLKLSEGVRAAEETLGNYVVTPQLAQAFDNALDFIKSALATRQSKAAYLHGSFGSGKCTFMSVIHLLLAGNTRSRSSKDLWRPIAKNHV